MTAIAGLKELRLQVEAKTVAATGWDVWHQLTFQEESCLSRAEHDLFWDLTDFLEQR